MIARDPRMSLVTCRVTVAYAWLQHQLSPNMTRVEQLHHALQLLYDSSSRFRVSVDTIQRLAKHLTLDTFVDSEALASPASRLSIAGQLLLLDVDFTADDRIENITLSLGSHSLNVPETQDSAQGADLSACLSGPMQEGAVDRYHVSLRNSGRFSFFRSAAGVCAESILRANLNGPFLGEFSSNLAYLATLDRLSPPEGDMISTMDHIALYLALVHHKETELDGRDDVITGSAALCGAVLLNDEDLGRLGVFLKFWESNRTLGLDLGLRLLQPSKYLARLSAQSSATPTNYFKDTQTKSWNMNNKDIVLALDEPSLEAIKQNMLAQNWHLLVSLDTPVTLPKTLVEYLGLPSSPGRVPENITAESDADGRISFYFEDTSELVRVKEFPLSSLHQLSKVVSALRNQITFSSLIHSVIDSCNVITGEAAELTTEASKKIRHLLKLADDVPDEELMGLNSVPNDFMSAGRSESGLDDFMNNEYAENDEDESDMFKTKELAFSLVEILYDTPCCDYLVRITGTLTDTESIDAHVVISNGRILQHGDVDMDGAVLCRFIQALALSEHIPLALKVLGEEKDA